MGADVGGASGSSSGVKPGALTALLRELAKTPRDTEQALPAFHAGQVVGRFELLREIGRGGFGRVYQARDRELGRNVAFKALRTRSRIDLGEERLLHEAEAAARLSHPNIVTLYDVGRCEQGPYMILELLTGHTLAERMAQGTLPLREALRIGVEVARGVAHAHAHGVVHRDLTPGNIFLCDDGQVKVLDFGLAHAFGHRKVDGGTRAYMAPEQARGAPEDERTDVFALGVMLHQMLSGELPFSDAAALAGSPAPGLDVPEHPALGELVGRMLEKDPVNRPRDAGEVLSALAAFQRELDRLPSTRSAKGKARRRSPRFRWFRPALRLVGLGLLAAVSGLAWYFLRERSTPPAADRAEAQHAPATPSIAVLPFADMSPRHDQEYFSDGIAEEILNALARVDGLHVTGRTSSFSFKGKNEDLRTIGRMLNVATVLEGSVRKEGTRLRITAQVVDVADGFHVWSETYDRELKGVFAIQDEIARAVVDALKVKLLADRGLARADHRPASPEAYEKYLIGREYMRRGATDRDYRLAAESFEKALSLDPGYAPALAGLSWELYLLAGREPTLAGLSETLGRSLAAAEKAIALDPSLPDGYIARAYARWNLTWDILGGLADFRRALALSPGDARANWSLGVNLLARGRAQESLAPLRRATELDPLYQLAWHTLALSHLALGDMATARAVLERGRELNPDGLLRYTLGLTSLLEGQPAAALAEFERLPEEADRLRGMALARHALREAAAAQEALDALTSRFASTWAYQIAEVHAWRGERDAAIEWLERAYRQRDSGLWMVKFDPLLRSLRGDPRYDALLDKLNVAAN